MVLFAVAGPGWAGPGWAGAPPEICTDEATDAGRAACLALVADEGLLAMETYLAGIATSLQGARAAEIAGFEQGLMASQADWRRKAERTCRREPVGIARQSCRITQVRAREVALAEILEQAFAPLGGVPGTLPFSTDGVEVFVPLDGARDPRPFIRLDTPLTPRF